MKIGRIQRIYLAPVIDTGDGSLFTDYLTRVLL